MTQPVKTVQLTQAKPVGFETDFFLGPWCRGGTGEKPVLVESIFHESIADAIALRTSAYNSVLSLLTEWLNRCHGMQESERYWELLLFRFLNLYVEEMLCRYLFVKGSLSPSGPALRFAALSSEQYETPESDYAALRSYDVSDRFNLQMFSQICETVGADIAQMSSKSFLLRDAPLAGSFEAKTSFGIIKNVIKRLVVAVRDRIPFTDVPFSPTDIVLLPSLFTRDTLQVLGDKSPFTFRAPGLGYTFEYRRRADRARRATLLVPKGASEFERCILLSLRTNLPKDYLENFTLMRCRALRHVQAGVPRQIFGSFFPNVLERLWIAECRKHGSNLFISQHGGLYGESLRPFWQESELRLADEYLSWGWTDTQGIVGAHIQPMPAIRLLQAKKDPNAKKEGLLFVLRTAHVYPKFMYSLQFDTRPDQIAFITALNSEAQEHTQVRVRLTNHAPDDAQGSWMKKFPALRLDRGEEDIYSQINQAQLVVTDCLFATAFSECISADVPVIAFGGDQRDLIRKSAEPTYALLHEVGIVHYDAASAARLVNEIINDPKQWWKEPKRQAAVAAYRDHYARSGADTLLQWKRYFTEMVAGATTPSSSR